MPHEGLTAEQMRGMLRLRHAQISQQLDEMRDQLVEVEVRLHQLIARICCPPMR